MPIKGLTDRDSIKAQFPRLGKLRKGGPKTANKPGVELDHWRFTSDSADVQKCFDKAYGKEPRSIGVYLPHARLEDNFATWKEKWAAGGLQHRCDGETCLISRKGAGYSQEPIPCPGGCKEVGRLVVVLPELVSAGYIGTVTMETHGNHDLRAITGVLKAIEDTAERNERTPDLRGIPFSLARVQEEVSAPGWGDNKDKRVRVKKWNVKLTPHPDVAKAMLMSAEPVKALPAPVDYETGEIVDAETEMSAEAIEARNEMHFRAKERVRAENQQEREKAAAELDPSDDAAFRAQPPIPQADGTTEPAPEAKPRIVVSTETVAAALSAQTPSGNKMYTGSRLTWSQVAANSDGHYSSELAQHAAVLMEAHPDMIAEWMQAYADEGDVPL